MKTLLYILAGCLVLLALILLAQSKSAVHETVTALIFLSAIVSLVGAVLAGGQERLIECIQALRKPTPPAALTASTWGRSPQGAITSTPASSEECTLATTAEAEEKRAAEIADQLRALRGL